MLKAITTGPRLSIRGTIHQVQRPDDDPLWVPVRDGSRVWRHGQRLRVESSQGIPIFITNGTQAWDFSKSPSRPVAGTPDGLRYFGHYQFELGSRTAADWQADEFTKPIGPVVVDRFAGRRCWTMQLAPPRRKPHPLRIWVDIDSGQILGTRVEEFGEGTEFTDLVIGEELDDTLFQWDGPTMTPQQLAETLRNRHRERELEQAAWFAGNVTATPLHARVPIDFTPTRVHTHTSEPGAFDAMNDRTALSRHPRSADGWEPRWGDAPHYVWSTPSWDWAARVNDQGLDDETIQTLQYLLHPGEPVDRQRRIGGEHR